jgi:hypothetical protein
MGQPCRIALELAKFYGKRMPPMASLCSRERRALLGGVFLVGASMLLLELFAFRLSAATMGTGFATFVALTLPAAAGLGAMVLGARRDPSPGDDARRAAHLAASSGAALAAAVITLSWVSQTVAGEQGEGSAFQAALLVVVWIVPALLVGASLAAALRAAGSGLGRATFAEALGGAAGCLLAVVGLGLGAPRFALASALFSALAAFAFAYVARARRPRWSMIATLPLAVTALVAGDLGAPFLELRSDLGRRTTLSHREWTTEGMIGVHKAERGFTKLQVDRSLPLLLGRQPVPGKKPRLELQDLGYAGEVSGVALVVGSAGGRDVEAALAYGHERVDAFLPHAALVRLLRDSHAEATGYLLWDERVTWQVGEATARPRSLGRDYRRIVVLAEPLFVAAAPRLMNAGLAALTAESVTDYLSRLAPEGTLTLRVSKDALPAALGAVNVAIGGSGEAARAQVVACSDDQGSAVALVLPSAPSPKQLRELTGRCRKNRWTVEHPPDDVPRGRRDQEERKAAREARIQALWSARPPRNDRPFLDPPPALRPAMWDSLRALEPSKAAPPKPPSSKVTPAPASDAAPAPQMNVVGIAAAGTAIACVVLVLVLGLPLRQPRRPGVPIPWRGALALFGAALALGLFATTEGMLALLGDRAAGWPLLVPLGLVGIASGRLVAELVQPARVERAAAGAMIAGALWLVALSAGIAELALGVEGPAALGVALLLVAVTGWLFGAAFGLVMQTATSREPGAVGGCWAAHHAGWALGGALAALLVHYWGVSRLYLVTLAVYVAGSLLFAWGAQRVRRGRVAHAS